MCQKVFVCTNCQQTRQDDTAECYHANHFTCRHTFFLHATLSFSVVFFCGRIYAMQISFFPLDLRMRCHFVRSTHRFVITFTIKFITVIAYCFTKSLNLPTIIRLWSTKDMEKLNNWKVQIKNWQKTKSTKIKWAKLKSTEGCMNFYKCYIGFSSQFMTKIHLLYASA